MWFWEKANSTVKLYPLEISYYGRKLFVRKLYFAASEQQRHRSDCDDVKTANLSVEIIMDKPECTSGKFLHYS